MSARLDHGEDTLDEMHEINVTPFMAEDRADLRRWVMCGAVIVFAHGAIAAGMVTWRDEIEPAEPAAAIVIEFAPMPVAPAAPQTEIPPGPEQVMSDASPNKPVKSLEEKEKVEEKVESKPVEEPPPEIKPAPNPDVAVEPPPQEVPTPQRQEPRPPAPTTSAPQALPDQTAAIPAAPIQGRITPHNSNAVPTWKTQIVALLERNKRYPAVAQSRREQRIAQVFFSLDRKGRVIDSRISRSSGASALDEEALALLRRAQPFPAPPRELPGDRVDLTVPIRFNLR
ncbi:MAG TPA: TonB family protein [Bradyrhizobium sp.]|jgi:protein TonB|nr:TonB family protein [Bradyrhizobium sp.]